MSIRKLVLVALCLIALLAACSPDTESPDPVEETADAAASTDEIEEGYKYGFNSICIEDDLFTLNRNHVHTICDEIIRRKLDISLHVFARVDTVDKLLLEKMKEAGCSLIVFGVESGSQKILDIIKKKTDLQKIRHAVALTKEVGIDVLASFILGLPGETKETLKITTEFAKELDTYYGFHILAPFPGTEVREKAEELGLKILSHNWKHYNADIPITETDDAKREDVYYYLNQYNRAVDSYNKHQDTSASNGTLDESELQEVEKRHQKHFAWELLTKDLVEKLGQIEYADTNLNTKESLTTFKNKLVNHMPFSENFIEQGLQKLIQQGLLVHQSKGNNSVWRWSSNEELLSHSPDDIADLESAASYPPDIRSENTERVYLYRTKI